MEVQEKIRDAALDDFAAVLALNADSVHFLSPLSRDQLAHLHRQAAYHRVIEHHGRIAAFLLVLRKGADYSQNYRWFDTRFESFLYIDRVVADRAAQGRGLGRRLYADLFDFAAAAGITRLACEFDLVPPNEASAKFHAAHGFVEVGTQMLPAGKLVSLQLRDNSPCAWKRAPFAGAST